MGALAMGWRTATGHPEAALHGRDPRRTVRLSAGDARTIPGGNCRRNRRFCLVRLGAIRDSGNGLVPAAPRLGRRRRPARTWRRARRVPGPHKPALARRTPASRRRWGGPARRAERRRLRFFHVSDALDRWRLFRAQRAVRRLDARAGASGPEKKGPADWHRPAHGCREGGTSGGRVRSGTAAARRRCCPSTAGCRNRWSGRPASRCAARRSPARSPPGRWCRSC